MILSWVVLVVFKCHHKFFLIKEGREQCDSESKEIWKCDAAGFENVI